MGLLNNSQISGFLSSGLLYMKKLQITTHEKSHYSTGPEGVWLDGWQFSWTRGLTGFG